MVLLQTVLTGAFAAFSVVGVVQVVAGWLAVIRFARTARDADRSPPAALPPITILKPLRGNEPLLAEALATFCEQDYPAEYQIVFGVQDQEDSAVPVVRALRATYKNRDIRLVIDPARHGDNPKIGNLINMLPAATHDTLVIADSDVHAQPDYLRRLAYALAGPGVGLVTALYAGLPAVRTAVSLLGTSQITHGFLPGVLLGRALGRRDCLGATMCLTCETLVRIGGLEALRNHLADDNMLGRYVQAAGLDVALAQTVLCTTVPENRLAALWRHELRWARTTRALEPIGFAASVLQYPLLWVVLALVVSGGAAWAWALTLLVLSVRAAAAIGIDHTLRLPGGSMPNGSTPSGLMPSGSMAGGTRAGRTIPGESMAGVSKPGGSIPRGSMPGPFARSTPRGLALRVPVWLLPLRDLLSVAEWIVSHTGRRVDWRGQTIEADTPPHPIPSSLSGTRAVGVTAAKDLAPEGFAPDGLSPDGFRSPGLTKGSHA